MIRLRTNGPEGTHQLGRRLAALLRPGDVVLLRGTLGAGKTALVRGVAAGLGSDEHVSSPTFVFIHEYSGRLPVAHVDLYRMADAAGIEDLGLRDYLDGRCVVLVEWPERADDYEWGADVWKVDISPCGEECRDFNITPPPGRKDCL